MAFDDIKEWTFKLFEKLSKHDMVRAIMAMRNKVEEQEQEIKKYKTEVQQLKDTINRLKGEKGKPDIKPPKDKKDDNDDQSNTGSKNNSGKNNKNNRSGSKKDKIKITRTILVEINKSTLPEDAEYKGTREITIQDIKINLDNVKFVIPVYYSPSEGKNYEGKIPPEYKGSEFGPGIWFLLKQLHFEGRITQNVLEKMLKGMGVKISKGQINTIITSNKGIDLPGEMEAAKDMAISKQSFTGIDDTGARVAGKNAATIAVVNNYMSYFFTSPSKNRLSAINALTGKRNLCFCLNDIALNYINDKVTNKTLVKKLRTMVSEKIFNEEEFAKEIIDAPWIKNKIKTWKKHIKEGCALGALKTGLMGPHSLILICDDAPQFKGILDYIGLCWVHEIRHYKKLEPTYVDFKDALDEFFDDFWNFYDLLKNYKEKPGKRKKRKVEKWFDEIFSEETNYFSLNHLKVKTLKKKKSLLLVLDYPEIPLHNNATELSVREKVVQRNIKHCFKTWYGAHINDLYLSIMATCRKIGVSFGEYLKDRFYHKFEIPALAQVIETMP
jgi:hypothetical protein